ncbi:MAG TPA: DoxX family protein, partial [Corynebacterium sp.]|nr:DoxX family protein [Corynebacterium sp.]
MIRKIARPMIASVYIADGADSLLNTSEHTEAAETLIKRARAI